MRRTYATATHCRPLLCRGSTSPDGKVKTTYEQDLKVTQQWMEFLGFKILSQQQERDQVRE
jgi:hypothetical protein